MPDEADTLVALSCAVLADGASRLCGATLSPSVEAAVAGLTSLGLRIHVDRPAGTIELTGCGGHVPESEARLDFAGQVDALASLLCILAVGHGSFVLDADKKADVTPLADALQDLGAWIGYERTPGRAPVHISARGLGGGKLFLGPAAAPFLPALLPALPYAGSDVLIELTGGPAAVAAARAAGRALAVMQSFGAETLAEAGRIVIPAPQRYRGCNLPG